MRSPEATRCLRVEMLLVLGLSLGKSAVYSVLSLIEKLTRPLPLAQQTTTMNSSTTPDRPWLDLAYQVVGLVFPLVPVAVALYLLGVFQRPHGGPFRAMGFDLRRPGFDLGVGAAVFAGIGIAGLGLYFGARALGLNTAIAAADLTATWWAIPVLILRAIMNGLLEEIIMVGYLFTRWRQAGGGVVAVLIGSAVIRGTYHLYQGFGGFVGNLIMGLLLGWLFLRTKRVMPLVVVHSLLDIFAFVGYALLKPHLSWL